MSDVNKLRNASFRTGQAAPTHWEWAATGRRASWERPSNGPGATIVCDAPVREARLQQIVRCKPDQFYRVEAVVSCSLAAKEGGFAIRVGPEDVEEDPRRSPAIHHTAGPTVVRTYYHSGPTTRRLRVSVEVTGSVGQATITTVRLVPILEPDELSHPMAIPPPPRTMRPPRVAHKVCVCSATASSRRLTDLLGIALGPGNIQARSPRDSAAIESIDAILFPDSDPPPAARTLTALKKLAEAQIVVMSLPAFAKLAGRSLSLQRIDQADDPIHAEVAYSNHVTAGFALHDAFPFAWSGAASGSFRQNHFRKTETFTRFCKRHQLITFLASMCDRDQTSHQPMALYRETGRGGLYVLDIEPAEIEPTTMNEASLAMHLLLNILGHGATQLGQFVSPLRKEVHFRDMIREFAARIEHIKVHDTDAPSAEVTEQLVTVGSEDQSYGLPLKPKPLILIRSGLHSGDFESVFGAWGWLKQFIRPAPHACPYAHALASRFRIAWIPCAAPWEPGDGWQRLGRPPLAPAAIEAEDCAMAAMIDIVSKPMNRARVITAMAADAPQGAKWLPRLFASFAPTGAFSYAPPPGADFRDRRLFNWGPWRPSFECAVDATMFVEGIHQDVQAAGGSLLRIEVPGHGADFVAQSIARTDLVATVLEHVIGMLYGLIVMNRRSAAVSFDGFAPLAPGEAIILPPDDPTLQMESSQAV